MENILLTSAKTFSALDALNSNVYNGGVSDSLYVKGVRLGAAVKIHPLTLTGSLPDGHVVASADFNEHNSLEDVIVYAKPIKVAIVGNWMTIKDNKMTTGHFEPYTPDEKSTKFYTSAMKPGGIGTSYKKSFPKIR